jgi:hypothetical protein
MAGLRNLKETISIRGKPHRLAWVNSPEEAQMLKEGGSGRMVKGFPAYDTEEDVTWTDEDEAELEAAGGDDDTDEDSYTFDVDKVEDTLTVDDFLNEDIDRGTISLEALQQAEYDSTADLYSGGLASLPEEEEEELKEAQRSIALSRALADEGLYSTPGLRKDARHREAIKEYLERDEGAVPDYYIDDILDEWKDRPDRLTDPDTGEPLGYYDIKGDIAYEGISDYIDAMVSGEHPTKEGGLWDMISKGGVGYGLGRMLAGKYEDGKWVDRERTIGNLAEGFLKKGTEVLTLPVKAAAVPINILGKAGTKAIDKGLTTLTKKIGTGGDLIKNKIEETLVGLPQHATNIISIIADPLQGSFKAAAEVLDVVATLSADTANELISYLEKLDLQEITWDDVKAAIEKFKVTGKQEGGQIKEDDPIFPPIVEPEEEITGTPMEKYFKRRATLPTREPNTYLMELMNRVRPGREGEAQKRRLGWEPKKIIEPTPEPTTIDWDASDRALDDYRDLSYEDAMKKYKRDEDLWYGEYGRDFGTIGNPGNYQGTQDPSGWPIGRPRRPPMKYDQYMSKNYPEDV